MPTQSLYRQVLGAAFDALPKELQAFHDATGNYEFQGECAIEGPHTLLGRILGFVCSLPTASPNSPFSFELQADSKQETWRRRFPGRTMTSRMQVVSHVLVEKLGPVSLRFGLQATPDKLVMQLQSIAFLGIPCPWFLVPIVVAEETTTPGKLHFNVSGRLPLVGLLAHYQGFLAITVKDHTP